MFLTADSTNDGTINLDTLLRLRGDLTNNGTFTLKCGGSVDDSFGGSISGNPPLDGCAPNVTINQAAGQADPTGAGPIHFTAVFSEPVSGFTAGDVSLSGTAGATSAVVSETAPNDGTTYDVAVSGITTGGTVIASVAAGVATDAAGNGNTASSSSDQTVTYTSVSDQLTGLFNAVKATAPGKALGDKVKQIQAYVAANR